MRDKNEIKNQKFSQLNAAAKHFWIKREFTEAVHLQRLEINIRISCFYIKK